MKSLVDFHCHLDLFSNFEELVNQCDSNKIYTLAVTTTPRAWDRNKLISGRTKFVRAALGLHPQLVESSENELPLFFKYIKETRYIGEVGIDGSKNYQKTLTDQTEVFTAILKKCADLNDDKIISIHSRGAEKEVLRALRNNRNAGTPILHWYTGNMDQLEDAINLDCWFSVGPAMLKTKKGAAIVSRIPKNRILTETDGPFAKNRDIPLTPFHVEQAVQQLSSIWKTDYLSTRNQIFMNLQHLLSY